MNTIIYYFFIRPLISFTSIFYSFQHRSSFLHLHLICRFFMIVNDVVFLISMSSFSLLVFRSTANFCMFIIILSSLRFQRLICTGEKKILPWWIPAACCVCHTGSHRAGGPGVQGTGAPARPRIRLAAWASAWGRLSFLVCQRGSECLSCLSHKVL